LIFKQKAWLNFWRDLRAVFFKFCGWFLIKKKLEKNKENFSQASRLRLFLENGFLIFILLGFQNAWHS